MKLSLKALIALLLLTGVAVAAVPPAWIKTSQERRERVEKERQVHEAYARLQADRREAARREAARLEALPSSPTPGDL